jgi:2-(1,2-epoxy-1,2-dihydrophenyl)acetyl-CoA isomerase
MPHAGPIAALVPGRRPLPWPPLRPRSCAPGVLELQRRRPSRLHALTHALADALLVAVRRASADADTHVVLHTAAGRAFGAGEDRDEPPSGAFVHTLQDLAAALLHYPKPVVAAVQGWAVGAGVELALACDLVVAADGARLRLPGTALGLPTTGGVHMLLPRQVGTSRAKGWLWLGQDLDAERARQWRLVWDVVPGNELPERARALATELAARPPSALARVKRLVHGHDLPDIAHALQAEGQAPA